MKNTHVTGAISSVPTAEREDGIAADCAHERRLRILHAPPNTAPDQREGSPHQGDVSTGTREGTCWASVSCNVNVEVEAEATAKPCFPYACLWNYLLQSNVTMCASHSDRHIKAANVRFAPRGSFYLIQITFMRIHALDCL